MRGNLNVLFDQWQPTASEICYRQATLCALPRSKLVLRARVEIRVMRPCGQRFHS